MAPDPRLNAWRADLADARLRGRAEAPRFVTGEPARAVVGRAAVRSTPNAAAEIVTFHHYGEKLLVFDTAGEWAWCQSLFDGYVGYTAVHDIATAAAPPTHVVVNMGAYLYASPDLRSPAIDFLPRHSAVTVFETGLLTRGTEYARLDTGGYLPLACLSPEPPRSIDIVSAAECYLGSAYLWGGRSFLGIDCSGLVQSAFRDLGVTVMRDTDMQRDTIGAPASPSGVAELCRGDLLYMPGHVLIYAGGGDVVHADGATMMVRRDNLAELMRARSLDFSVFTVRRPTPPE